MKHGDGLFADSSSAAMGSMVVRRSYSSASLSCDPMLLKLQPRVLTSKVYSPFHTASQQVIFQAYLILL